MREMDRNGAHLPHAHVVAEAGSLPVAAVVTGYIENDPRCSRDAVPDAHPVRPSDTVRILVFILVVGLLLLVVALAQALLASDVKKNGIKVLDSWAFGSSYPTAGDPSIGFLALSIGALFVFISLLAILAGGTQRGVTVTAAACAVLSSLVLFVKSFGELAVYNALDVNDDCTVNIKTKSSPRGDCVCWAGDIDGGDLSEIELVNVDIASDAGMSCDRIMSNLDDIQTSYLLMAVTIGVLMITAIVLLVRLQRDRDHEGVQEPTAA